MDFDVEGNLGAAERSVWSMERDGRPARAVTLSRSYATSVEDVWDAVTNGERIPRWFLTVGGELELGGRYQLEGNAGGLVTACEPLSHFAITWEFGEEVSWVEVGCSGDGAGGARLTLTHTQHVSEHWGEYGPGALGVGWELGCWDSRSISRNRPRRCPTRPHSRFRRTGGRSSAAAARGGKQAAVAFGTDPAAARSRAGHTTAFYTGEGDEPTSGAAAETSQTGDRT